MEELKDSLEKVIKAKEDIRQAAADAVKVIARAANEASQVVAKAAQVSVGVLDLKSAVDHDLLIELKTKMEGLKSDIKDIKDGTSTKIEDHEKRLFELETSRGRQSILITIGVSILIVLISMIIFHLTGVNI
jgi:hypothetical protein